MNSKYVYIIIIAVLLITCIIVFNGRDTSIKNIPTYKSDLICTHETNTIYIFYDDNKNITKLIYQEVTPYDESQNKTYELNKEINKIYNKIKGINASIDIVDDKLLEEITYDFSKIDLIDAKKILISISDDNILLKKVDSLPIKYSKLKEIELEGYECI